MDKAGELIERHQAGGKFVEVDGLKIFYREEGTGGRTPLILTHGIPRSSFLYRRMLPLLGQQRRVIAWDLYGFGLSDKPTEAWRYRFPRFEEFLGRFIDELGIEKAHLVCHDVGGPFTIGYAVRHPERTRTLTILNTTVFLKGFRIPGPVLASILTPMFIHRRLISDDFFGRWILGYMQSKAHKDPLSLSGAEGAAWQELITREGGRLTLIRTLKAYRVVWPYLRRIQKALPSFRRPTLILWGKRDPFCPAPLACKFMRLLPNAKLDMLDAGHFLQEDEPAAAAKIILDFINQGD